MISARKGRSVLMKGKQKMSKGWLSKAALATSIFLVAFLQGCVLTGEKTGSLDAEGENFSVRFGYKGFGAGPQPVRDVLELSHGSETRVVSRAVIDAMQSFQLSVIEPPAQLDTLLPPNKTWKTDVARVTPEVLDEYNRLFPEQPLPTDRIYGIQYTGMYSVVENEFRFIMSSILYHRGSASDYRLFSRKDYAGRYFFQRVKEQILKRLRPASTPAYP